MADSMLKLDRNNFDEVIAQGKVLVDFWATWCAPCKALMPTLEAVAAEQQVVVAKINVDEEPELAARFGVRGIPTLILFSGGRPVDQLVGQVGKPAIDALIKKG